MKQIYFGTQKQISGTTTEIHSISSTKKEISRITKLMAISFLLFFTLISLVSVSSALEIQLNAPTTINNNEEFSVSIDADTTENHDVKIFVHEAKREFSEIYDGSAWRSPQRYLLSVFPSQKDFQIRAHYEGETRICVRLRKTGETSFEELCENIIVNAASQNQQQETTNNEDEEDNESTNSQENQNNNQNQVEELKQQIQPTQNTTQSQSQIQSQQQEITNKNNEINNAQNRTSTNQQPEKLVLNPKTNTKNQETNQLANQEKSSLQETFTTKSGKTRMALIYGFISLCILIIILLLLRKL